MGKSHDAKKNDNNQPAKTLKEKKQAKKDKKDKKENASILSSSNK